MDQKDSYQSRKETKGIEVGDISFGLIDKGVPATTAFSFANVLMFLKRGYTIKIDHEKEIKSQLRRRLKLGLLNHLHVQKIDLRGGLNNLPEEINYDSYRAKLADFLRNNSYQYLIKAKGTYSLVRTNSSGHKVTKIKPIAFHT